MKHQARAQKTQVLIIGGGITGLAAALYFRQQGIAFILIEKHQGTSVYPRARTIDVRTMELFRALGLSHDLREGGKDLAPAWGIIRGNNMMEALQNPVEKITPAKLIATQQAMQALAEKSPESVCRCTQDISESIIYEKARQQGSDIRFLQELLSFEQDADQVAAVVKDRARGETYTIIADYMVAADGANSPVRARLNIPTYGNIEGKNLLNIYFEADLEAVVKGQEFSQFLLNTPERTGFLLTINNKNKWAFHLRYYPEKGETLADYPDERLQDILHEVLGIPGLNITIIKVLPWQLTVRIATHLRDNRVFIAGDAAHTMTPYAGKGANSGIQDVHNLAWKLAAVLTKKAAASLLDTYHTERQPIGAYYATLSGALADEHGLIDNTLMITKATDLLGIPNYGYASTAVIRDPGVPFTYFTGAPGTRLPHLWLDDSKLYSSLDWVRGKFVLIANRDGNWQAECDQVLQLTGLNITLLVLEDNPIRKAWQDLTQTSGQEALLVRPDDFIAARLSPGNLMHTVTTLLNPEPHKGL